MVSRLRSHQASKVFPRNALRHPVIITPRSTVMLYSSQSNVDDNSLSMILKFLKEEKESDRLAIEKQGESDRLAIEKQRESDRLAMEKLTEKMTNRIAHYAAELSEAKLLFSFIKTS